MKQEALIDALQAVVQEPVLCNVPMSKYTTWKIGGPADILVSPSTEDELSAIMRVVHDYDVPWMVVGNGSNLLVADKGIRGVVIHMGGSFSHSVWNGCEVEADSGMLLATLALEAAERSLSGLEFARGIPGSVGGGVRMNAGAYGGNLGQLVTRIEAIDRKGEKLVLNADQLEFGYRNTSLFELDAIVTKVHLKLVEGDSEQIMEIMKEYSRKRSANQPLEYPSCGSVFRNPPDDHAGHLIEMAGLRGTKCGGVEVSTKHGNFIINTGGGTAADVRELVDQVQQAVYEYAGIQLEPEVRFVGEFE